MQPVMSNLEPQPVRPAQGSEPVEERPRCGFPRTTAGSPWLQSMADAGQF